MSGRYRLEERYDFRGACGELEGVREYLVDVAEMQPHIQIWTRSQSAGEFGSSLSELSRDMRRAVAVMAHTGFDQFELAFFGVMADPRPLRALLRLPRAINSDEGDLELVSVGNKDSLLGDFLASGQLLTMIADLPRVVIVLRQVRRRLPFRVTWGERGFRDWATLQPKTVVLQESVTFRFRKTGELKEVRYEEFGV